MKGFFEAIENIATPEKLPSQEKLPKFAYINADTKEGIFECSAMSIDEADRLFEAKFGFDPNTDESIELVQVEEGN